MSDLEKHRNESDVVCRAERKCFLIFIFEPVAQLNSNFTSIDSLVIRVDSTGLENFFGEIMWLRH